MEDIHARVNSDREAVATITTDLGASIDGNTALLNEEKKVRATETSALAKDVLTLQVTAGNQGAAITELNKVAADSLSANARAVHQLQLDVSSVEGDVAANSTAVVQLGARVTSAEGTISTQGQAITQLDSRLDAAEGDISGQASAITNLTTRVTSAEGNISAVSSQVSSLSTTVGGHTATLTEHGSSISGIMAEKTIKLDVNGHISGLVLRSELGDNGAVVSEAAFVADKFAIVGPGDTPAAPFVVYTTPTVVDGVTLPAGVYMKQANISTVRADRIKLDGLTLDSSNGSLVIKSGGVKTVHVGNNQITAATAFIKGSDEEFDHVAWTQVLTSGNADWYGSKPLLIEGVLQLRISLAGVTSSGPYFWKYQIKVDGAVVFTSSVFRAGIPGEITDESIPFSLKDTSVAGSNAATVEVLVDSASTSSAILNNVNCYMKVTAGSTASALELKK